MEPVNTVEDYIAQQRNAVAQNPECGTSYYNLAIGLLGRRKFGEAEEMLHKSIECSPTLAEAYVQLGGICMERGDLDGCLDFNTRAVNCRAQFSEGYGNIGFVHLQRGDADKAIPALEKAIRYNPKFLQAHATLANAYLMTGLFDQAIETNLKVLELEPEFAVAHHNLSIAYLEKEDYASAVKHNDQARALGYKVPPEFQQEIDKHR